MLTGKKRNALPVPAGDEQESLVVRAERAAQTAAEAEAEWKVTMDGGIGTVSHVGQPRFTCQFIRTTQFEFEEAGQELCVNDPVNGRVFYDFRWRRFEEPVGEKLAELAKKLMKVVQLRVGRR